MIDLKSNFSNSNNPNALSGSYSESVDSKDCPTSNLEAYFTGFSADVGIYSVEHAGLAKVCSSV